MGGGILHLLGGFTAMVSAIVTPASVAYGPDSAGRNRATGQVVSSIISYTRWPVKPEELRLCVVGSADHAGGFDGFGTISGMGVSVLRVTPARVPTSDCGVLYLGQLSPVQLREQTDWARGRGVLTIAEADPACRSNAMFCLVYLERGLTFDLNVDAISRSGLRVDPRVLRLARETS